MTGWDSLGVGGYVPISHLTTLTVTHRLDSLILGGGFGFLAGEHGLVIDSLLEYAQICLEFFLNLTLKPYRQPSSQPTAASSKLVVPPTKIYFVSLDPPFHIRTSLFHLFYSGAIRGSCHTTHHIITHLTFTRPQAEVVTLAS